MFTNFREGATTGTNRMVSKEKVVIWLWRIPLGSDRLSQMIKISEWTLPTCHRRRQETVTLASST